MDWNIFSSVTPSEPFLYLDINPKITVPNNQKADYP